MEIQFCWLSVRFKQAAHRSCIGRDSQGCCHRVALVLTARDSRSYNCRSVCRRNGNFFPANTSSTTKCLTLPFQVRDATKRICSEQVADPHGVGLEFSLFFKVVIHLVDTAVSLGTTLLATLVGDYLVRVRVGPLQMFSAFVYQFV